jgi:hypothetical protein
MTDLVKLLGSDEWETIRKEAAEAHMQAWSLNAAQSEGWVDQATHNQGMTDAVLSVLFQKLEPILKIGISHARDKDKPCKGTNMNICVAQGCFREACIRKE